MPRIPLNLFGASFGIAGLAGTMLTLAGYAVEALGDRRGARTDLTDPVAAPFAALAVITPVLLVAGV